MTGFVYAIEMADGKVKVGHSRNVRERMRLLAYVLGDGLAIRHEEPVPKMLAREIEEVTKYRFERYEVASEIFCAPLPDIIAGIKEAAAQTIAGERVENRYIPFKRRQYPDWVVSPFNYKGTHERVEKLCSAIRLREEVLREALSIGLNVLEGLILLEEP